MEEVGGMSDEVRMGGGEVNWKGGLDQTITVLTTGMQV